MDDLATTRQSTGAAGTGSRPEPSATPRPSRIQRRKAQTRQKLITAARVLLADGTGHAASVQDITETADVGFGSFYNHFTSKDELFAAAVTEVLDELGDMLDQLSADIDDPAQAFALSVRLAARLAIQRPDTARILLQHGMAYMDADRGLAPRALRDIERGIAQGRFQITSPRLGLASVAGSLLATLHLALGDPEAIDAAACDELTEALLRMLGLPPSEAHAIATAPLPDP